MTKFITRFAPSPTGLLHVGNIRTALVAWLFIKKHDGDFVLRIDDTDEARSTTEYEHQIKADLEWLGLKWESTFNQKDRAARYQEVLDMLVARGRVYPCYETQEELAIKRKIQLSSSKAPIYDRRALKLTAEDIKKHEQEGRKPHYRFFLEERPIQWDDLVRGTIRFETLPVSDPIILREDGSWIYTLCSVVDDIDYKISHIVRGEDHITNTATQIQIFQSLDAPVPVFAHLARVNTKDAEISKRTGGFDIKSLRGEKEIEAMTIINFFSSIGTNKNTTCFVDLEGIIAEFDISSFHKSPTTYDEEDLLRLNHKILAAYKFEDVHSRIADLGINVGQEFWDSVKHNLKKFSDVKMWHQILEGDIGYEPSAEDREFLAASFKVFPEGAVDETTWDKWVAEIKLATSRSGKALFLPIRLALTGLEHGPELKGLLPILGREKIANRLAVG